MLSESPSTLIFCGTSHPTLGKEIADQLGVRLGFLTLERFEDGEISVQILDNVRNREVFVLQAIALKPNDYLLELLIIVDALKRASASSITAVVPYYGYCRQDRKDKPRVPITAKLVANLLVSSGVSRLLTMDLHAGQVQGFFDIPVDHLYGRLPLLEAFREFHLDDCVVVAPDIGSVKTARAFASQMGVGIAIVDKNRVSPFEVKAAAVIGDVKEKDVLLADDMCSTGGTLVSAAKACREKGAKRIFAAVTHGLFVDDAVARIEESPIEALVMTNTIAFTDRLKGFTKLKIVSVAPLFAQAIQSILSAESITSLCDADVWNHMHQ